MPLVTYGDEYDSIAASPAIDITDGDVDQGVTDPGVLATLGASFRTDNVIGSAIVNETAGLNPRERDEGFNPLTEIEGTPYEVYADEAAGIFNRRYFEAWKTKIDREREDRRTIEAAGWLGTGTSALAAIMDAPTLIPGGALVRGARGGISALRTAGSVAAAGGVGSAVSETALQATQETRTASETAIAIGSGIVFGGLLGGGVGALMSRMEQRAAVAAIDNARRTVRTEQPLTPVADDVERYAASVGAAARETDTLEDLSIAGRAAGAVGKSTAFLNPILRALNSPSVKTREILTGMMENGVYLKKNVEGRGEAAIETLQKQWDRGALGSALQEFRGVYREGRAAGLQTAPDEFNRQVAFAMRRNDQAADPWVQKAAQVWRSRVFNPLKEQAIEVGLLPADVDVRTAESYLMRMWNPRLIEAREGEFRQIAEQDVREQVEAAVEKLTATRDRRLARLNEEIADLETPAEERASLLERLPQELETLRQQNARFEPTEAILSSLRRQLATAREAGDRPQAAALTKHIDTVAAEAGKDYADYVTKRNLLQTRISRLRNNVVGREDQTAALQARMADIEAANIERLRRLHRSLAIIDEDIAKASPEVWEEKLAKARTQFAEVLDRSNKAQDRLARVRSQEAGDAPKLGEAEARFEAAETKRLAELARLADRIGEIEEVDPAEAVAELRRLVESRINDAASLVQRETARMVQLARRLDEADPKRVQSRVEQLRARAEQIERDYLDRVEIGLDRENNYESYVSEIVDGIYNTLTGRSVTDIPRDIVPATRGPLKERTWNIRDSKVEQFLENDIEMIARRYARTMSADVELTRRYGSATMADQILEVQQDYQSLRERVINSDLSPERKERELQALTRREKSDVNDLKSVRDLLRGNYRPEDNSTNFARIARGAATFNYLRSMGGVLLSSLTDAVRPAMVHGLRAYMQDGIAPLFRNLEGVQLAAKDAKLAGAISERILQSRLATLAELTDPYSASSPFERFLDNTAHRFSTFTGLNHWNDFQKTLASVMTQNRVLQNAERGLGNLKPREKAYMGYLGIDETMASRIARQFTEHGETVDNVRVANTEEWTDPVARRAYYAAINKDVDTTIVTKGVGDVPLFINRPVGRAILQFKSFALASNQRVLMRGLQEAPSRMIGGIVGMTAIGAFIYWLKQKEAGREVSNNPGNWIAEGLDRSGIFSVGFEINNMAEKLGAPGVYSTLAGAARMVNPAFDRREPASRFAVRGTAESLAGPSFGLINDTAAIASLGFKTATDVVGITEDEGALTPSDVSAARRLMPFASLPYWRWLIDGGFGFEYGAVPMLKEQVEP